MSNADGGRPVRPHRSGGSGIKPNEEVTTEAVPYWQQTEVPRRRRMDQWTPAETAINSAVLAVESMDADPRLTDAVTLLGEAQERVADFVDGVESSALVQSDRPDSVAADALQELLPGLRYSRETHRQWRDHISAYPDELKRNPDIGDADFHRRCVEEYDQRIAAIEAAIRALCQGEA